MTRISLLAALLVTSAALAQSREGTATLTVEITGFEQNRGSALVQLSSTEAEFAGDHPPLRRMVVPVAGGIATATFDGLPFGDYAVSVAHDEDGNGKMNKSLFGVPREAFGFSRNPVVRGGRPKFAAVKFPVDRSAATIQIHVARYGAR